MSRRERPAVHPLIVEVAQTRAALEIAETEYRSAIRTALANGLAGEVERETGCKRSTLYGWVKTTADGRGRVRQRAAGGT